MMFVLAARRAWPWMARCLVVMLVPLVVLSSPVTAQADTMYGSVVGIDWPPLETGGRTCHANAYYSVNGDSVSVKVKGGHCDEGPGDYLSDTDLSKSWVDVTMNGTDAAGNACTLDTGHLNNNGVDFTFNGLAGPSLVGLTSKCQPTQACVDVHDEVVWGTGVQHERNKCTAVSLGALPVGNLSQFSCPLAPKFRPIGANAGMRPAWWNPNDPNWENWNPVADAEVWTVNGNTIPGKTGSSATVDIQPYFRSGYDGSTNKPGSSMGPQMLDKQLGFQTSNDWAMPSTDQYKQQVTGPATGTYASTTLGVVIRLLNPDGSAISGQRGPGWTDPQYCSWWIGQKIVDDPNTTSDEPVAALSAVAPIPPTDNTVDPNPADPAVTKGAGSCHFAFSDPSTWLSGGMCKAVGLLTGIASTLLGLPAAIMGLLSELLQSLFVPSHAVLDAFTSGPQDQIQNSALGQVQTQMGSVLDGIGGTASSGQQTVVARTATTSLTTGGSGCAGPSLTWDKLALAGLPTKVEPFNACSGTMADVAGWCHLLCTVFLCIAGGFKFLNLIADGLGVMPQIKALQFDWSGASQVRE